jgi:hypothetical protein
MRLPWQAQPLNHKTGASISQATTSPPSQPGSFPSHPHAICCAPAPLNHTRTPHPPPPRAASHHRPGIAGSPSRPRPAPGAGRTPGSAPRWCCGSGAGGGPHPAGWPPGPWAVDKQVVRLEGMGLRCSVKFRGTSQSECAPGPWAVDRRVDRVGSVGLGCMHARG